MLAELQEQAAISRHTLSRQDKARTYASYCRCVWNHQYFLPYPPPPFLSFFFPVCHLLIRVKSPPPHLNWTLSVVRRQHRALPLQEYFMDFYVFRGECMRIMIAIANCALYQMDPAYLVILPSLPTGDGCCCFEFLTGWCCTPSCLPPLTLLGEQTRTGQLMLSLESCSGCSLEPYRCISNLLFVFFFSFTVFTHMCLTRGLLMRLYV